MNCKPGDLAIVVGVDCSVLTPNIGLLVEVIEFSPPESWWVRARGPSVTANPLTRVLENHPPGFEATVSDRLLRPIRPPRQSVTECRDVEVTA